MKKRIGILNMVATVVLAIAMLTVVCEAADDEVDMKELTKKDGVHFLTKSGKPFTGKYVKYDDSGRVLERGSMKDGKEHGINKAFYESGKLKMEANVKDGKLYGAFKEFYENGKLRTEGNFNNDKLHGTNKTFYENGKLRSEANYKDGDQYGIYKEYYEDGKLSAEINMKNDKAHGIAKTFYENGKLSAETNYKDGEKHGVGKYYDEDGKLIKEMNWVNGKRVMLNFTDARDSRKYDIVNIGTQTWMAENLDYKSGNSWCYDEDPEMCKVCGRLYDWATAMKSCPKGWHLPSGDEWNILLNFAGGGEKAGMGLKANSGWAGNGKGIDFYDFTALPCGNRSNNTFSDADYLSFWWSTTEYDANSTWALFMAYDTISAFGSAVNKYGVFSLPLNKNTTGISVRCVKD